MPIYLAQLAQEDGATTGGNLLFTIVLYAVVIGGLFYFLLIRPQRTRARRHQELVTSLEVDDEVQTICFLAGAARVGEWSGCRSLARMSTRRS